MGEVNWTYQVRIYDPIPQQEKYILFFKRHDDKGINTTIQRLNFQTGEWESYGPTAVMEVPSPYHFIAPEEPKLLQALADALKAKGFK